MSRYKGRTDLKEIEKAFPHIVEQIVPLGVILASGFLRRAATKPSHQ